MSVCSLSLWACRPLEPRVRPHLGHTLPHPNRCSLRWGPVQARELGQTTQVTVPSQTGKPQPISAAEVMYWGSGHTVSRELCDKPAPKSVAPSSSSSLSPGSGSAGAQCGSACCVSCICGWMVVQGASSLTRQAGDAGWAGTVHRGSVGGYSWLLHATGSSHNYGS